jgi:tetratricopeptide (TPR) repeat protein
MATKKKASSTRAAKDEPAPRTPAFAEAFEKAKADLEDALSLLHGGEHAKALEAFKAIEMANPGEPELCDRARSFATVAARKLTPPAEEPTNAEGFYYRGVLRSNRGELDDALADLNRALETDSASPRFLYARASVYALQGRAELAAADLRRAVQADPTVRFQATSDPDFESIRDEATFIDVIEPSPSGA